jgi:uncharacterized membrane protein YhaH (DUF805 family)
MSYYIAVLKNYAGFSGRARRAEYWYFTLFYMIVYVAVAVVAGIIHAPLLLVVYQLAMFIPSLAVGIRRMHDTDHSGWWILLPIVNLIFAVTEGSVGDNDYGADPKAVPQTA